MPLWPYFLNRNGERHGRAGLALGGQIGRHRLAVVAVEHRLGVERVDVRRPAVHEQVDDPLGPRRSGGGLGKQRIRAAIERTTPDGRRVAVGAGRPAQQPGVRQQAAQRQGAHAHARAAEQLATGHDGVFQSRSVIGHELRPSVLSEHSNPQT